MKLRPTYQWMGGEIAGKSRIPTRWMDSTERSERSLMDRWTGRTGGRNRYAAGRPAGIGITYGPRGGTSDGRRGRHHRVSHCRPSERMRFKCSSLLIIVHYSLDYIRLHTPLLYLVQVREKGWRVGKVGKRKKRRNEGTKERSRIQKLPKRHTPQ